MDTFNSESSGLKQQLDLDGMCPEAVKFYTDIKEELEKYNEEMREMYGRLLLKMIEVTSIKAQFTSIKRNMQIGQDNMKKYELENNKFIEDK